MGEAIYLDYAATTPVDPFVTSEMSRFLSIDGVFGNPASRWHAFGQEAARTVEKARQDVANLINADPSEIIWTSGATESDNLAIKGAALSPSRRGKHIVTSAIEHKAVLGTIQYMETQGFDATYIWPDSNGVITPKQVEAALRPDTALVSLMHVNNETGAITDIKSIANIIRRNGAIFHVDAAQSAARLPLDMQTIDADLVSLSAHKMYGPKGIGALYVRRNPTLKLHPQMHGGGHEQGMRSGTLPTHQIVGMGEASRLALCRMENDNLKIAELSKRLLNQLTKIEGVSINGNRAFCVPGIINMRFTDVESEALMTTLVDVAISTGSACSSTSIEPSHVLMALGLDEDAAHSSLRISIGRFTTQDDIARAVRRISESVRELRAISRLWGNPQAVVAAG